MKNNIVVFKARSELSAEKSLDEYIKFAKEHSLVKNWSENSWDLTDICGRSQKLKKVTRATFSSRRKGEYISPAFMDGAKAIFSEFIRRKRPKEVGKHLQCLRLIEQALINLDKPVKLSEVDAIVMDEAGNLLNEYKDKWSRGKVLEVLVKEYINPAMLTPIPIQWSSPFPYKAPLRRDRLGKQKFDQPNTKLPDIASIIALAEVANESSRVNDQIVCAFVKLAMFAPSRISEILTLPVDCITHAQAEQGLLMGIAWRPVKGGQTLTKFAVTETAAEMATSSIEFLIRAGKTARKAAAWYLKNPNKIYLPQNMEHLREMPVTWYEISKLLGREKHIHINAGSCVYKYGLVKSGTTSDKSRWPSHSKKASWVNTYTFDSVEKYVLKRIPTLKIDNSGLTLDRALFCLPANILRPGAISLLNVPDIISISQIDHQLGNNPNPQNNVYARNNKTASDGTPWKITSHQFRHLLNTLAQSKYLSQSLIAFWSGRKSVKQNDWYNHLEQDAFIEAYTRLAEQTPELNVIGPLNEKAKAISAENLLTYREALSEEIKTVHITRYGICRHDWSLTPCPKDKDCINCGENLFMKGENKHLEEAKSQVLLLEKAVTAAHSAITDGRNGAKRWLDNNKPKLDRWKMALEMLSDPNIPDRTIITLPPPAVSQTQVGMTIDATDNNQDSDVLALKNLGMI